MGRQALGPGDIHLPVGARYFASGGGDSAPVGCYGHASCQDANAAVAQCRKHPAPVGRVGQVRVTLLIGWPGPYLKRRQPEGSGANRTGRWIPTRDRVIITAVRAPIN